MKLYLRMLILAVWVGVYLQAPATGMLPSMYRSSALRPRTPVARHNPPPASMWSRMHSWMWPRRSSGMVPRNPVRRNSVLLRAKQQHHQLEPPPPMPIARAEHLLSQLGRPPLSLPPSLHPSLHPSLPPTLDLAAPYVLPARTTDTHVSSPGEWNLIPTPRYKGKKGKKGEKRRGGH